MDTTVMLQRKTAESYVTVMRLTNIQTEEWLLCYAHLRERVLLAWASGLLELIIGIVTCILRSLAIVFAGNSATGAEVRRVRQVSEIHAAAGCFGTGFLHTGNHP